MEVEVVRHSVVVEEVSGDVVAVDTKGNATSVKQGDVIPADHILIVADKANVMLVDGGKQFQLEDNCVACQLDEGGWGIAEVAGEVSIDESLIDEASFSESDLAAIQDAILEGADPTEILEATAAGGAGGSANAGFVTVEFNNPQTEVGTFFETQGIFQTFDELPDDEFRALELLRGRVTQRILV
ncbi:retention module-containing protein [Vibrio mexicanus]|uniref:retention module-containing protein n=1 Tax=Vibrio mexicanus TaxID=1004326 RepID=UPI00063C126A|nr:retention module-containing protein [Vibrio mexicanus]